MWNFFKVSMVCLLFAHCSKPLKNLSYFKDGDANTQIPVPKEAQIAKGDILNIVVSSDNPKASELFNIPNYQAASLQSSTETLTTGYLVDERGNIQFYQVGEIHVEGKTKFELTGELKTKLAEYLNNPIINVRLLNFKITVLGEVNKPGTFSIPNERVNILEALGLAGDLTIFGERKTVKIIRNSAGKNEFVSMDLTNKDIFNSPYFNLKQNDIIYVDVNPRKINNTDQTTVRNVGIATGLISSIAFIITVLTR